MKLYDRIKFQGNLKMKNYFEGWYFKMISKDLKSIYSIIPGISLIKKDPHAFIQIIEGHTGKTHYIRFDLSDFHYDKSIFFVSIGDNQFSRDYISLSIDSPDIKISGGVDFLEHVDYPSTVFSPGIMGAFSFLPKMECNHEVVSVSSKLGGELIVDSVKHDLTDGKGYIEKDWGTSFPEGWIWLQCNTMNSSDTSLFLSIAKIPYHHFVFPGMICFLYKDKKFYNFSTYVNAKITSLVEENGLLSITLKNKTYELLIKAVEKGSGSLIAPVSGEMQRVIKESVFSDVEYTLINKKTKEIIYTEKGTQAGLEISNIEILHDLVKGKK